jgi:hypothetical protein
MKFGVRDTSGELIYFHSAATPPQKKNYRISKRQSRKKEMVRQQVSLVTIWVRLAGSISLSSSTSRRPVFNWLWVGSVFARRTQGL